MKRRTTIFAILATALLTSCRWINKGPVPPDGMPTDTTAAFADDIGATDTTLAPAFLYYYSPENMHVVLWTDIYRPDGGSSSAARAQMLSWQRQELLRRNAAAYTRLHIGTDWAEQVVFNGEELSAPDGSDLDIAVLHNSYTPSAALSFAFRHEKHAALPTPPDTAGAMYVLTTAAWTDTHRPLAIKGNPWHSKADDKPLPQTTVTSFEHTFSQKAVRSHTICSIDRKWLYGIIEFRSDDGTAIIADVLDLGDTSVATQFNDADTIQRRILAAFNGPQGPELYYEHTTAENTDVGVLTVADGMLRHQTLATYSRPVGEGRHRPFWRNDFEALNALYMAHEPDSMHGALVKWCFIDIDDDGYDEVWLRSDDDRYGAFFAVGSGEPQLICTETERRRPKLYIGRIRIGGADSGQAFVYANYILSGSRLTHTFTKREVYGAFREARLDGRQLSQEECLNFQETLSRKEHPLRRPEWHHVQ